MILPSICPKFFLAAASLAAAFVLTWFAKDVVGFTAALAAILGFYNGANVAQSYFDSKYNSAQGEKPKA